VGARHGLGLDTLHPLQGVVVVQAHVGKDPQQVADGDLALEGGQFSATDAFLDLGTGHPGETRGSR